MIEALVLASPSAAARGVGTARPGRARGSVAAGWRIGGRARVSARIVPDDADGRAAAAIEVLRAGGIVALPTDTVYGIAVALDTPGGIERLFHVKRRPPDKGIVLLLDVRRAGGIDRRRSGRRRPRWRRRAGRVG